MSYFIHPWTWATLTYQADLIDEGLAGDYVDHTASNLFRLRGVQPGDVVYVITWMKGAVRVHGSLTVDRIVDQRTAERELDESLWEADDHAIAAPGTATLLCVNGVLTPTQLEQFEFISPSGSTVGPAHNRRGKVDHQSFRAVREISADTARVLDKVIARTIAVEYLPE